MAWPARLWSLFYSRGGRLCQAKGAFLSQGRGKAGGKGRPEGDGDHVGGVCRQGKREKRTDVVGSEIMHPHILYKLFLSTS